MAPEFPTKSSDRSNGAAPTPMPHRELSWKVATNLFISFRYAWSGVSYAFRTQRNFRIHVVVGVLTLGCAIALQVTAVEVAIIGLTAGAVLGLELLNTAIESVVDLTVQQQYHDLARIAKDCSAAAVLISALTAVLVGGVVLLPRFWAIASPYLLH